MYGSRMFLHVLSINTGVRNRPLSTHRPIAGQQIQQRRAPDDSPFQKQSHSVNKALQASRGKKKSETSENSHLAKERGWREEKEWKNVFI